MKRTSHQTIAIMCGAGCILAALLFNEYTMHLQGQQIYVWLMRMVNLFMLVPGLYFLGRYKTINMRRVAVNLTVSVLALTFILFALELLLRIIRPEYKYAADNSKVAEPIRLWKNGRNTIDYFKHVDTGIEHPVINNSFGFRQHREFDSIKAAGVTRIGFFGDSYVENIRVPAQYSFTEPLDYMLNQSDGRFEVMNFGTDGYATDQCYLQYLEVGNPLNLDVVVYVYCNNDIRDIANNDLFRLHEGALVLKQSRTKRIYRSLIKHFYLTYLVVDVLQRYHIDLEKELYNAEFRSIESGWKEKRDRDANRNIEEEMTRGEQSEQLDETVQLFTALLTQFKNEVEQQGSVFYVVTLPSKGGQHMGAYLVNQGFDVLSLYELFSQYYQHDEYRFKNDYHWNEEGNKMAAYFLMRFLNEKGDAPVDSIEHSLSRYYYAFDRKNVTSLLLVDKANFDVARQDIHRIYLTNQNDQ